MIIGRVIQLTTVERTFGARLAEVLAAAAKEEDAKMGELATQPEEIACYWDAVLEKTRCPKHGGPIGDCPITRPEGVRAWAKIERTGIDA